jgi:type VI secretion system protein ImpL
MLPQVVVGTFATLLIAGAWIAGAFFSWPIWVRLVISLVALVLAGAWIVISILRARARARGLERDLLQQAEKQAMAARPDRRAEMLELQAQVKHAIGVLKASKLGSRAGGPLYALPWYVMIGPPGAGKTTALRHSGLSLPVVDRNGGGSIKGVGGTRNCDWWFTNEGILLDTAGRYTTENEDHEEWLGFLDMLRKYRPQKPINGVLVSVSIPDLVDMNEEAVTAFARRLRARIDELMSRLKMVVPVYVMFTKADLIAGFSEVFDDLRRSERGQIWGATFPLPEAQTSPFAAKPQDDRTRFERAFDDLARAVFARTVRRLGMERRPDARLKIFHFPLEYRALKQNLSDFVTTLFERNAFNDTPMLRGVYFSSGTQEGRPTDRVLGHMMRAFNIARPATVSTSAPPVEPKSYFVTDMFRKVIFPDQDVAARSASERTRQLALRGLFAVAAVGLGILLAAPAGCTWSNNRELLRKVDNVTAEAAKVHWRDGGNVVEKVQHLDDMRDQLKQLETWKKDGAPLEYHWGMYAGNDIYVPLRNVYVANLHTGFAIPTKAKLEEDLRATSDSTGLTTEQYNVYFSKLKTYLLACDKDRLAPEVEWESNALTDAWGRTLATVSRGDHDVLKSHVAYYVDLMKGGEVPLWDCDASLITRVRAYLKRLPVLERDYSALVRDATANVLPITRDTLFQNTAFYAFISSASSPEIVVPGAFTKAGWELYVRDRLGSDRVKQLLRERWVLGETENISAERSEKQLGELRDRYFQNYQRAWTNFLKDLTVRQPQSNEEALDELSALSEVPWPYQRLLKSVDENTRLDEAPADRAQKDIESRVVQKGKEALNNTDIGKELADAGVVSTTPPPRRWESPVELAFRPIASFGPGTAIAAPGAPNAAPGNAPQGSQLAHYQERIVSKLVAVLTDLRDSKGRGIKGDAVTMAFQEAIRGTNELLNPTQSGLTRPLLSPLLLRPLEAAFAGVENSQTVERGASWENDIWRKWAALEDSYPFADTWHDAKLSDYSAFFKPNGGLLFGFFNANLKESVELLGTKHVATTRFGHTSTYSSKFLKCYDRGLEIAKATFDEKADQPNLEFEVNLHSVSPNVSEVTVEIDGASHTYRNTPEEWLAVKWPAPTAKDRGSRVKVRGYSGLEEEIIRPGEWGWFRVLDAAKAIERGTEGGKKGAPPVIVATWELRTQKGFVRLDVRPSKEENPFVAYVARKERLFRDYECPRVIAGGSGPR